MRGNEKRETTVGNAAALHEYAKRLVDAVKEADLCDFIYGSDFCKSCMYNPMCKAARDCESALAAPPRNCDVGTIEEQKRRFFSEHQDTTLSAEVAIDWMHQTYKVSISERNK